MKKTTPIRFIVFLLSTFFLVGYMPPSTPPEEAFAKGKSAFIAQIRKLEVSNESDKYKITAIATMKVLKCFYGENCIEENTVTMSFVSNTFCDYPNPCYHLNVNIGKVYLFVLVNTPSVSPEFVFDQYAAGGTDYIYAVENIIPPKITKESELFSLNDKNEKVLSLRSMFYNMSYSMKENEINTIILNRKREREK